MNENLAYVLGYHIGDGSLRRRTIRGRKYSYEWILYFNARDEELARHVSKLMSQEFNILPHRKRRGNCIELQVYRKDVVERIHGLTCLPYGRKVDTAGVPESIKSSNKRLQRCFLSGLVDAEFGISWKDEEQRNRAPTVCFMASFASKMLALQTTDLLQTNLGLNARYYRVKRYDKRIGPYLEHQIRVSGHAARLLFENLSLHNPHLKSVYNAFLEAKRDPKNVFWQPFEVGRLKNLVLEGAPIDEISREIGRSRTGIFRKMNEIKPEIVEEFRKVDWQSLIEELIVKHGSCQRASRALGLERHVLSRLLRGLDPQKLKINNKRRITLAKIMNSGDLRCFRKDNCRI